MTSTPLKTSDISIIIPTLNEEINIPRLASHLQGHDGEILISDGGSSDATQAVALQYGFKVTQSKPGRANQLNHGARRAKGRILLFLHADTILPENFGIAILDAVKKENFLVGAFRLAIDNPTIGMRFICACANLRSRLFNLPYGDQALFLLSSSFFDLKMYPELPIMEDYVFIKNAQKKGKIVLLNEKVVTSARRWKKLGILRTTIINQMIILGFFLKIAPEKLASFYRR